jgi:hypothetical protein
MSFFKKLFGGGTAKEETPAETYEGFAITPTPIREGTQWRISARIEKKVGDAVKTHTLMRADTVGDKETAEVFSVRKAKQVIDEQGDRLFG